MMFLDAFSSTSTRRHAIFVFILFFFKVFETGWGKTHQQTLDLYRSKLNNVSYNTEVRPVWNQSDVVNVSVRFSLVSIVDIDDIAQDFSCNGLLVFTWKDEIIAWNPSEYGNITRITPNVKDIWKPRMNLVNTLQDRDPFKDDFSSLEVYSDGQVIWYPSCILTVSCDLDLYKFPFDEQECWIFFIPMKNDLSELVLHSSDEIDTIFYRANSEWDLMGTRIVLEPSVSGLWHSIKFIFKVRRRPYNFLMTLLLPVVFLSILSFFLYFLNVESGEKVTYGVTVLLAKGVFLSTLTNMLPPSSVKQPSATIYLFTILVISSISVMCSTVVDYLHHKESAWNSSSMSTCHSDGSTKTTGTEKEISAQGLPQNVSKGALPAYTKFESMTGPSKICRKYSKGVNAIAFVVTAVAWTGATGWYLMTVLA